MLSPTKQEPREAYVVKKGYVYTDAFGNHYREGDVVYLTEKEYSLSRHRVERYVEPKKEVVQGKFPKQEGETKSKKDPENKSKKDLEDKQIELPGLKGLVGRGEYEIK